jgi:hypothetical protein
MKHIDHYKTAKQLKITESERAGLIRLTRILPYTTEPFDMRDWDICVYGWLNGLDCSVFPKRPKHSNALFPLFVKCSVAPCWQSTNIWPNYMDATATDAARAIIHFLTFGE